MAYSNFSLSDLEKNFGLRNRRKRLFEQVTPVQPSEQLRAILKETEDLPVRSEKAKSEWIVVPVLRELRNRNDKFFTIYSGDNLVADEARGLNGECDFVLAKDIGTFDMNYPILQIVEAKKNDLELGVPQCAAQMLGARIFNENKGVQLEQIYGCVTTGNDWLFMQLNGEIYIDTKTYYLESIHEVMGIFQQIIDFYKERLP